MGRITPAIRPIETFYRGYRFRSRLEARWAVFLDAAGVEWSYEPEGFNLAGRYYLPDFWLHRSRAFLEIKPDASWFEEREKFAPVLKALANAAQTEVFLIQGSPSPENPDGDNCMSIPHVVSFAPQKGICSARIFECPHCRQVAFRRIDHDAWTMWCECRGSKFFEDTSYDPFTLPPRVRQAMRAARQARFEHGETPA